MNEKYIDESGDKKYFTIIPNYIANHSTANDQSLYFQMKRISGDGGICEAGYRYFVKKMGIGYKAFKKSRNYLLKKKWISYIGKKKIMTSGGEQMVDCYKVNDIWKLNNTHYKGDTERKHLKGGADGNHPTIKVVSKEHKVVLKGVQGGAERKQKKNYKNNKNNDEKLEFIDLLKKYPKFNSFYEQYPKKIQGRVALKSWIKLNPNNTLLEVILKDIEKKKKSRQWQKDDGDFIQYPATYLNQRRWEDELDNKENLKKKIYGY